MAQKKLILIRGVALEKFLRFAQKRHFGAFLAHWDQEPRLNFMAFLQLFSTFLAADPMGSTRIAIHLFVYFSAKCVWKTP